jgi:26S proteasome regulatory subunit N1
MAQDDKPVADKGKAPAEKQTTEDANAKEPQEQTTKDGKKAIDLPSDELNEEDQKLKDELEMLVERLHVRIHSLFVSPPLSLSYFLSSITHHQSSKSSR